MFNTILVGCGAIGAGYRSLSGKYRLNHLDALTANSFFRVTRVFDVNYLNALDAGNRAKARPSDLLDELSQCRADLAVLAGPDYSRKDHVQRLVNNESVKVIVCEKPLGLNKFESDMIIDEISRSGKVLITNYIRSWDDALQKLIKELKNNRYGQVRQISVIYSNGLRNTGSHLLALLTAITSRISVIHAFRDQDLFTYSLFLDSSIRVSVQEIERVDHPVFDITFFTSMGELNFRDGGHKVYFKKRVLSEWVSFSTLGETLLVKDSFYSHLDSLYSRIETAARRNYFVGLDNSYQSRIVARVLDEIETYAG